MTTPTKPVALVVPLVAALAVLAMPLPLPPTGHRALAIATWMVISWLLEPIHAGIVGLTGCFLFWVAKCVAFDGAFAGFGTEVPWFVYGGLTLLSAVQLTGLDRRLGEAVPAGVAGSFLSASIALVALGLLLGFVIPSAAARAILLGCLALGVSFRLDRGIGVASRAPLVAVASYAAAVLGPDPGAASPSLAWRVVTVLVVMGVAARFVRPVEPSTEAIPRTVPGAGAVAIVLGVAAVAWLTTALHGVAPAIVGLAAGCLVSFPGFRPRGAEFPKPDPLAVILAGTAASIPLVLQATGATPAIATAFQGWLAAGSALGAKLTAYAGYVGIGMLTPARALAASPPATAAAIGGLNTTSLDWIAVCASTAKLALYQSPALIIGAAVGNFSTRDVIRFGVALTAVGAIAALLF